MKGADEESRAGCGVRLEVAFMVHHAAKSAPSTRVSNTAKAPKKSALFVAESKKKKSFIKLFFDSATGGLFRGR